jgi:hypothetical protein
MFYGRGVPQLHRTAVAIMAVLMVVSVYPFAKWFGIVGGQLACLLAVICGYAFQLIRMHKLTNLNLARYSKPFLSGFAISLAVLALCLIARSIPVLARPVPNILFGAVGCLAAYTICGAAFLRKRENFVV